VVLCMACMGQQQQLLLLSISISIWSVALSYIVCQFHLQKCKSSPYSRPAYRIQIPNRRQDPYLILTPLYSSFSSISIHSIGHLSFNLSIFQSTSLFLVPTDTSHTFT
jgi:hypothetical protein